MERDIVQKNEGKLSVLQIVGFCLMLLGVAVIITSSFMPPPRPIIPSVISISFFVTMLGFAFAFPSLFEGNEGLSTMRIIVFMVTNVICMLLLKIGWADGIVSLEDIGLDQYWVGIIAFVFGAKATQSFFESRMAIPKEKSNSDVQQTNTLSDKAIIEQAVLEVKKRQDKRVIGVGCSKKMENGVVKYFLQMNVIDDSTKVDYENNFRIKDSNGQLVTPPMYIVVTTTAVTHSNKLPGTGIRNITGVNGDGTFGCVVTYNDTGKACILSCQHVLKSNNDYNNIGANRTIVLSDGSNNNFGTHFKGMRDNEIDAGIALLDNQTLTNKNLGKIKGERDVTDNDVMNNKKVTLKGYDISANMVIPKFGVILNNKFEVELDYQDGNPNFKLNDVIVLTESTENFKTISKPGYSGSLVIDEDRFVIGLVVGGDDKFTYAIPINKIKEKLNLSILK